MTSTPYDVHQVNIVYTVDVHAPLHLDTIFRHTKNCEYNQSRFAALKHRFRANHDAPTFLVFPTGKIVCVGCKTREGARSASSFFLHHLSATCGCFLEEATHAVRNIVSATEIGHSVHLEDFARQFPQHCSYEPEVFPGLTYLYKHGRDTYTFLLFSTGKVVITGVKEESQVSTCVAHLQHIMSLYNADQEK